MKVVLETTPSQKRNMAWLQSKWWFRLFQVVSYAAVIFISLLLILGIFIGTSECQAAEIAAFRPQTSQSSDMFPTSYEYSETDPLGLFSKEKYNISPKIEVEKDTTKIDSAIFDLILCYSKNILIISTMILFTWWIRYGIEVLFIYIVIGPQKEATE